MIKTPAKDSYFWIYLSQGQKGLIEEGLYLVSRAKGAANGEITDFSYLVFPFAKAYEGFLKQLFLDLNFISRHEYESDRFRIGRALNPYLEKRLRRLSVYDRVVYSLGDESLAQELWQVWKIGRNQVFHYFPHNFKALSFIEAEKIIDQILQVMEKAIRLTGIDKVKKSEFSRPF